MTDEIRKSFDLAPLKQKVEKIDQKMDDDFDFARKNIYDIANKYQEVLEDMIDVARQSQHPRAFEVLNQMLKGASDVSKDLIDIQKKKREIEKIDQTPIPQEGNGTINNNLIVTTAEFSKMIENIKNKSIEHNNE